MAKRLAAANDEPEGDQNSKRIHEYGKENPECILLIHPSLVTWDYFENLIPLLEKDYHLLIPALPGYNLEDHSEFSSVEQTASDLVYRAA